MQSNKIVPERCEKGIVALCFHWKKIEPDCVNANFNVLFFVDPFEVISVVKCCDRGSYWSCQHCL